MLVGICCGVASQLGWIEPERVVTKCWLPEKFGGHKAVIIGWTFCYKAMHSQLYNIKCCSFSEKFEMFVL